MKVDLNDITENVFRMQTNTICSKFREAALIYSEKRANVDAGKLLKHTDALLFKFTLSVINLEFLWKISEKSHATDNVELVVGRYEWNNTNSIIDSIFLESTIIQIRAFIDFAQKLSCVTLGYLMPIDGTKDFYKVLDRLKNEKATVIKKSFITMDNSWGDLIRNLRDKVLHYDLIKTNHEYRPKLRGKSYEEFAQHLTNNMFDFLIDLNYLLFEVEWVSGTFDEFKRKYDR